MKKCPLFPTNPTHSRNKTPTSQELEKILNQNFGYSRFRGNQLEAIQAVLSGRDCFCLMPTGGGKSMCYQIPALARPGIVLVVSPLIALMENQVAALKERGICAEFLSSTQLASVKQKINEDLDCGKPLVKLLYVTPELMATAGFISKLGKIHARGLLSLVAIDEAHCISSWGHDFRPSYRKLSSIRDQLSDVPLLALTATAAPKVQNDVIESLGLQDPLVLKASFNRPNIFYEVRYKDLLDNTYLDVSNLIKSSESACSIIYCLERSACDELCAFLTKIGISCAAYHAGLNNKTRSAVLDDWLSSKIQVVVATVAFGMGIDRKDVRIVCHFNVPKSMEAFYQESGRAGRDQVPSRSILYYGLSDRKRMEFILSKTATAKKLQKSSSSDSLSRKSFADFSQIVEYCEGSGCRRKKILKSFGEQVPESLCQKTCDACKDPNMVATYLGQLEISRNVCQNYDACAINFKSSSCMAEHGETEFWNREDETEMLDEDISESDDGSETVDTSVVMIKMPRSSLKQKIDLLQRAEETYYQKTDPKKQADANVKKVVPETLREASKQRLLNSLKKAQERFGKLFINFEESSRSLEVECFKKYGKVGRTFYNSQIASTIRWLSSSCYKDISDRLSSCDANSVSPESPVVSPMADSSVERLSSSSYKDVESPYSSDAKLIAPPESQLTSPTRDTLLGNHSNDTKNGDNESLRKDELPPIPSFSEFVNKKEEGTFPQWKDLANPNLSSRTGSSKGAQKRLLHADSSGKRMR